MITPFLTQEIITLHAELCSALADPNRILILYALTEGPKNVGELASELSINQPAASRHLNILRKRGLVVAQRQGQLVVNTLVDHRVIDALDLLRSVLATNLRSQAALVDEIK